MVNGNPPTLTTLMPPMMQGTLGSHTQPGTLNFISASQLHPPQLLTQVWQSDLVKMLSYAWPACVIFVLYMWDRSCLVVIFLYVKYMLSYTYPRKIWKQKLCTLELEACSHFVFSSLYFNIVHLCNNILLVHFYFMFKNIEWLVSSHKFRVKQSLIVNKII